MRRGLLLAIAACGGSSAQPDAGSDALESTGNVTVIVTEHGRPVTGVPVFFRSASGDRELETVTSLEGSSGFDLEDGTVTVLLPRQRFGIDRLYTFAAVQPGRLFLELGPLGPRPVEVTVTVAADAQPGPLVLYTSCDAEEPLGVAPGVPMTLALACRGNTVDLLAARIDPDTNVPLTSQSTRIDLEDANATLPGPYTSVAQVDVAYANPGGATFAHTLQSIVTPSGRLFDSGTGGNPTTPDPLMPTIVRRPSTAGTTLFLATNIYPVGDAKGEQTIYSWEPMPAEPPPPITVDLAQRLPTYTSLGAFDVTANRLAWEEDAAGATADAELVRAQVRFTREDFPAGTSWTWSIVAPRTGTSVQFPPLPRAELQPHIGDLATVEELTNLSLPVSYDDVRARGFGDIHELVAPTAGQMIVQRRFVPEP